MNGDARGISEQLSSARFAALQAQLNPHFLFNTLNTIAVLVRDNERQSAVRIVEDPSELLRSTLRHRAGLFNAAVRQLGIAAVE